MQNIELREVYVKNAVNAYNKSDKAKKFCSIWCYRIVGNYEIGATLGLADDMGVENDTVENMAHAYSAFIEMFQYENGQFAKFVFNAYWRSPYIKYSHFRALWDAKRKYNFTTLQMLDLLMDIVQAEGNISSRKVDIHARSRYGAETDWTYDAQKLQKKINIFLQRPDVPAEGRKKASELLTWIGENA